MESEDIFGKGVHSSMVLAGWSVSRSHRLSIASQGIEWKCRRVRERRVSFRWELRVHVSLLGVAPGVNTNTGDDLKALKGNGLVADHSWFRIILFVYCRLLLKGKVVLKKMTLINDTNKTMRIIFQSFRQSNFQQHMER